MITSVVFSVSPWPLSLIPSSLSLRGSQAVQQDVDGQRQLWADVLWARLQPLHRETGGALPLQVPLVLLRHLQEVRKDSREIHLQISPLDGRRPPPPPASQATNPPKLKSLRLATYPNLHTTTTYTTPPPCPTIPTPSLKALVQPRKNPLTPLPPTPPTSV